MKKLFLQRHVWKSIISFIASVFFFMSIYVYNSYGFALIVSIVWAIAGIRWMIIAIYALSISETKEYPEEAFDTWASCIFGNVSEEEHVFNKNESKNIGYRIHQLEHLLPENINLNQDEMKQYIINIREKLTATIDEIAETVRQTYPQLKFAYAGMTSGEKSVTMPFQNVAKICAIVVIKDVLKEETSEIGQKSTIVKLHITQFFIEADDFWYPYDVMPEFHIQT